MSDTDARPFPGPERDFVGYGPEPPRVTWPGGAVVAVNLVVNHEEGGEYSLADDGVNDTWGEYSFQYGPEIRDLGNETHMEYGSRVGVWRICRLIDRYQIPATFNAVALALERNPPLCDWLRDRDHDVLGHGYHWYGPSSRSSARPASGSGAGWCGRSRPCTPGSCWPRRAGSCTTPTPTMTSCRTG